MSARLLPQQLTNAFIRVRFAWGADVNGDPDDWDFTDETLDLRHDPPINITPMGRSDWAGQAQPAVCTFRVKNPTGKYSKGRQSPNWPNVVQNTPVQVQVSLDNQSTWDTLYQGECKSFNPVNEGNGKIPVVAVRAAGILDRLGGRDKPIRNLITRYHLANGAAAIWSFDDGPLSRQAANAVPNGAPMAPVANSPFTTFGHDTSDDLPAMGTTCTMDNADPGQDVFAAVVNVPLSGNLHIDIWRRQAAEPDASETQLLVLDIPDSTGKFSTVEIRARASQNDGINPITLAGYTVVLPGGLVLDSANGTPGSTMDPFDDSWHNVHVQLAQISGNVGAALWVDGVNVDSQTVSSATLPSLLTVAHVRNAVVAGAGIGNFDRQSVIAINTTAAGAPSWDVNNTLYAGELLTDRLERLCLEEGVAIEIIGDSTVTMGPQGPDTFVNLLRECEATDTGGMLGDGRGPGLFYVTRLARYNLDAGLTIDASAELLGPGFAPVDDPQRTVNVAVVKNKNGSSATSEVADGPLGTATIGTVSKSFPVNMDGDSRLDNTAAWLTHVGTNDEPYRYPTVPLDFKGRARTLAADWLALQLGAARIDLTNVDSAMNQHPAGVVKLLLEGSATQINRQVWNVVGNCSPYQPWVVAELGSTLILELAGQTLGADLDPGDTTISIATATGHCLFTTSTAYPGDFPVELDVDGWRINVTSNTDGTTPQVAVCDAAPNTATIPAGTVVKLWRPAPLGLA